jgi:hypothetical protein
MRNEIRRMKEESLLKAWLVQQDAFSPLIPEFGLGIPEIIAGRVKRVKK